jgi:hypothetical protein
MSVTKSDFVTAYLRKHAKATLSEANKAWKAERASNPNAARRADREVLLNAFEEKALSRDEFDALIATQPESIQRNRNWWEKIWLMSVRIRGQKVTQSRAA